MICVLIKSAAFHNISKTFNRKADLSLAIKLQLMDTRIHGTLKLKILLTKSKIQVKIGIQKLHFPPNWPPST